MKIKILPSNFPLLGTKQVLEVPSLARDSWGTESPIKLRVPSTGKLRARYFAIPASDHYLPLPTTLSPYASHFRCRRLPLRDGSYLTRTVPLMLSPARVVIQVPFMTLGNGLAVALEPDVVALPLTLKSDLFITRRCYSAGLYMRLGCPPVAHVHPCSRPRQDIHNRGERYNKPGPLHLHLSAVIEVRIAMHFVERGVLILSP